MAKQDRVKFGHAGGPLKATRVLAMDMDAGPFKGIKKVQALIIIDDNKGEFVNGTVYDGNLGRNFDPTTQTHPLPAAGDEKWKIWQKKGYVEANVADFDVLEQVTENATA